ncbi:MAG: sigma-54 interaction domain-containing protein [Fibrobacterota bacterium]
MNHQSEFYSCRFCFREDIEGLAEIAHTLASESQQRPMLMKVLDIIEKRLNMFRGTIMLLLPDNSHLIVQAVQDAEHEAQDQVHYHRGEGIIGRVVETGKAYVVPDIALEPAFKNRIHKRTKENTNHLAFVCIPVVLENEVVGTLSVDIPHSAERPLDQNVGVVSIIGAMIASFLRTERLVRLERESWRTRYCQLQNEMGERFKPDTMIGVSSAMRDVFSRIQIIARSDTSALVRGPSGTGKELVATAIHYASDRRDAPLVKVNCAALSESLVESELFGHEKGAFTGALYSRKGRIEEAEGGTLFLDEIGEFSPAIQIKLLRVIQERQYERVGSNQTRTADIRLISATNRDLECAVANGTFREDLYYRINVFPITIPPLAQRKDDILPLSNAFVEKFSSKQNKKITRISTPAINMLMSYHWPGNVRELENAIEYAVLLSTDGVIYGHNLPPTLQTPDGKDITAKGGLRARVDALERDMIVDSLKRCKGNMTAAARKLGITPRMVRYKIKQLGINTRNVTTGQIILRG